MKVRKQRLLEIFATSRPGGIQTLVSLYSNNIFAFARSWW